MARPGIGATPGLGACCDCSGACPTKWQQFVIVRVPREFADWANNGSPPPPPAWNNSMLSDMLEDANRELSIFDWDLTRINLEHGQRLVWINDDPNASGPVTHSRCPDWQTIGILPSQHIPGRTPFDVQFNDGLYYGYDLYTGISSGAGSLMQLAYHTDGLGNFTWFGPLSGIGLLVPLSGFFGQLGTVWRGGQLWYPPLLVMTITRLTGYDHACVSDRTFDIVTRLLFNPDGSVDSGCEHLGDANVVVGSCGSQGEDGDGHIDMAPPSTIGSPPGNWTASCPSPPCDNCYCYASGKVAWLLHSCNDCACS